MVHLAGGHNQGAPTTVAPNGETTSRGTVVTKAYRKLTAPGSKRHTGEPTIPSSLPESTTNCSKNRIVENEIIVGIKMPELLNGSKQAASKNEQHSKSTRPEQIGTHKGANVDRNEKVGRPDNDSLKSTKHTRALFYQVAYLLSCYSK